MNISAIRNALPNVQLATPRQAMHNLSKIAVPIIVIGGAMMARGVSADAYSRCVDSCDSHRDAHPAGKLLCYLFCAIFAKG